MNPLYEKRLEEIISPKNEKPNIRIARFLNPIARHTNQVMELPKHPLVTHFFTNQNLEKWPINVHFNSWNNPHKDYVAWFDRLIINHGTTWIKAGIVDGILASLHEIPCNKSLVLGVSEFWCSKTSSFIFPWGEATISLEDVMILGGFPVIGGSHNKPLDGNLQEIECELRRVRRELADENYKCCGKKVATHNAWLNHFMEEVEEGEIDHEEGKFEHVAFLSLWLSRFVLCDVNEGIIGNYVFPIAIHLSMGTPIALAPVVLAYLYHEMTLLTLNALELPLDTNYYVSGLFKIVQLWVCERFPEFGLNLVKPLEVGDPRVVRWDNVRFEVSLPFVRSRLKLGEGFRWRPYACDLENWEEFPFYEESEQEISNCAVLDDCLLSFARFLYPCELNGQESSCKVKYQPHRVAMQFGYDQDLPGEFAVSDIDWDKGGVYIPSKTVDAGMSRSYCDWWKESILRHEEAVDEYFRRERDKCSISRSIQECERGELDNRSKIVCALLKPERDKASIKRSVGRLESGRCEPGSKGKSVCISPKPVRDKLSNIRLAERQENERRCEPGDKGNSVSASPNPLLETPSRNLDIVPLALRVPLSLKFKKPRCNKLVRKQVSRAVKLPQVTIRASHGSNARNEVTVADKNQPSDSSDMVDHMPLALRIQSFGHRPLHSYDSTENVKNPTQNKNQTEELGSRVSDAGSNITRGGDIPEKTVGKADREVEDNQIGSSLSKAELLARLAKIGEIVFSKSLKLGD